MLIWFTVKILQEVVKIWIFVTLPPIFQSSQPFFPDQFSQFIKKGENILTIISFTRNGHENSNIHNLFPEFHNNPVTNLKSLGQ